MKVNLYNDELGYVRDDGFSTVAIEESNLNEDNRTKWVTDLAAISRGKDVSANPPKRYKALLEEAAPNNFKDCIKVCKNCRTGEYLYINDAALECHGCNTVMDEETLATRYRGTPSRPLEFLPVVINYVTTSDGYILKVGDPLNGQTLLLQYSHEEFNNKLGQHSYLSGGKIYTNMRACLNAGISYENVPYNSAEELKEFRAMKAMVPMFVWSQVPMTHGALSKETQSDRVSANNNHWLPVDLNDKVKAYLSTLLYKESSAISISHMIRATAIEMGDREGHPSEMFNTKPLVTLAQYLRTIEAIPDLEISDETYNTIDFAMELLNKDHDTVVSLLLNGNPDSSFSPTQNDVQQFLKNIGYKREIYSRAPYYFKYKEVIFTGWNNDPKVWKHLTVERSAVPEIWKNWTQDPTAELAAGIRLLIVNNETA